MDEKEHRMLLPKQVSEDVSLQHAADDEGADAKTQSLEAPLPSQFSTGLCGCCSGPVGMQTCLLSFFLPCMAHGEIISVAANNGVGETLPCSLYLGSAILTALAGAPAVPLVIFGTLGRAKLRKKYGFPQRNCEDCLTHCFCHPCAMAQELRHIHAMAGADSMLSAPPQPIGVPASGQPQDLSAQPAAAGETFAQALEVLDDCAQRLRRAYV